MFLHRSAVDESIRVCVGGTPVADSMVILTDHTNGDLRLAVTGWSWRTPSASRWDATARK